MASTNRSTFFPTRRAFGVLSFRIENRIVFVVVSGFPPLGPGSPDDPNLVPPVKQSQNNDLELAPKSSQNDSKVIPYMIPKDRAVWARWRAVCGRARVAPRAVARLLLVRPAVQLYLCRFTFSPFVRAPN